MLDIRLIREKPEIVRKDLEKRGDREKLEWLKDLIKYDKEWRENLQSLESLKRERNIITEKIASLKKKGESAA
jgi:seryl-tRNA synthetase